MSSAGGGPSSSAAGPSSAANGGAAGASASSHPPITNGTTSVAGSPNGLLQGLSADDLRRVLEKAVQAGALDPNSLEPVTGGSSSNGGIGIMGGGGSSSMMGSLGMGSMEHVVGTHGVFEVPAECDRVEYLSEGGYGIVSKARVLNPAKYMGYSEVAVKKVSLPHEKAFDGEWEDNIRLIREIHFMKHLPHPNIAPIITMYLNREARADLSKLKCFYIVMPLYEPGSIYAVTK